MFQYESPDIYGERPIYTAVVKKPDLQCLKILLEKGAKIDVINISGYPLISRAMLNFTYFSIIETLVEYGASVDSMDIYSGKTPLHIVAMINDLKMAKVG